MLSRWCQVRSVVTALESFSGDRVSIRCRAVALGSWDGTRKGWLKGYLKGLGRRIRYLELRDRSLAQAGHPRSTQVGLCFDWRSSRAAAAFSLGRSTRRGMLGLAAVKLAGRTHFRAFDVDDRFLGRNVR